MTLTAAAAVQPRAAAYADAAAMLAIDDGGRQQRERINFINQAITNRAAHVATIDGQIVGFGILQYTFFAHGYLSMFAVDPLRRRQGVGAWLMRHLELACKTPGLFTTLPASNLPAQAFLLKLGYERSGQIDHLDEAETRLVFYRRVR